MAPIIRDARSRAEVLTKQRAEYVTAASKAQLGTERDHLLEQVRQLDEELNQNPVPEEPRLLVDDVTPEHLATKMGQNGGRIGVLTAEGDFFDIAAGLYSKGGIANIGVYLKGHAGDEVRVDRGSRPSILIPKPALSVGCCAQPEVARGLLSNKRFRGRGLLGRFAYLMPQSRIGSREINPPEMDQQVKTAYLQNMARLLDMPSDQAPDGSIVASVLTLDRQASKVFAEFQTEVERDLADFGDLATFRDWGGKLAGLVARVAALLHLAEQIAVCWPVPTTIIADTMTRAVMLGRYFRGHAMAVFNLMGEDKTSELATLIVKVIKRHSLVEFTRRDIHQHVRRHVGKPEEIDPALIKLTEHAYIRPLPTEKNGPKHNPSQRYTVNPNGI